MRRLKYLKKSSALSKSSPSLDIEWKSMEHLNKTTYLDSNPHFNAKTTLPDSLGSSASNDDEMSYLDGDVNLDITLPDNRAVNMTVDAKTAMLDLLVLVTTQNGMKPGGLMLKVASDRPPGYLSYKPSTPIGKLSSTTIQVVRKSDIFEPAKKQLPKVANQPFELTFRIQVDLPRGQKTFLRVNGKQELRHILLQLCHQYNLEEEEYCLRVAETPSIPLDLTRLVGSVPSQNFLVQPISAYDWRKSTGDLFGYIAKMPIEEKERSKSKGFFGLFSKKKKSSKKFSAPNLPSDPNSLTLSPQLSTVSSSRHTNQSLDDNVIMRSHAPKTHRPITMPPQMSESMEYAPELGGRKKRHAPPPPTEQEPLQVNAGPSLEKRDRKRQNSDSSGYHENSTLSHSPASGAGSSNSHGPPSESAETSSSQVSDAGAEFSSLEKDPKKKVAPKSKKAPSPPDSYKDPISKSIAQVSQNGKVNSDYISPDISGSDEDVQSGFIEAIEEAELQIGKDDPTQTGILIDPPEKFEKSRTSSLNRSVRSTKALSQERRVEEKEVPPPSSEQDQIVTATATLNTSIPTDLDEVIKLENELEETVRIEPEEDNISIQSEEKKFPVQSEENKYSVQSEESNLPIQPNEVKVSSNSGKSRPSPTSAEVPAKTVDSVQELPSKPSNMNKIDLEDTDDESEAVPDIPPPVPPPFYPPEEPKAFVPPAEIVNTYVTDVSTQKKQQPVDPSDFISVSVVRSQFNYKASTQENVKANNDSNINFPGEVCEEMEQQDLQKKDKPKPKNSASMSRMVVLDDDAKESMTVRSFEDEYYKNSHEDDYLRLARHGTLEKCSEPLQIPFDRSPSPRSDTASASYLKSADKKKLSVSKLVENPQIVQDNRPKQTVGHEGESSLEDQLKVEYEALSTMFNEWQARMKEHQEIIDEGGAVAEPRMRAFQRLQTRMVQQHQKVQYLCLAVEEQPNGDKNKAGIAMDPKTKTASVSSIANDVGFATNSRSSVSSGSVASSSMSPASSVSSTPFSRTPSPPKSSPYSPASTVVHASPAYVTNVNDGRYASRSTKEIYKPTVDVVRLSRQPSGGNTDDFVTTNVPSPASSLKIDTKTFAMHTDIKQSTTKGDVQINQGNKGIAFSPNDHFNNAHLKNDVHGEDGIDRSSIVRPSMIFGAKMNQADRNYGGGVKRPPPTSKAPTPTSAPTQVSTGGWAKTSPVSPTPSPPQAAAGVKPWSIPKSDRYPSKPINSPSLKVEGTLSQSYHSISKVGGQQRSGNFTPVNHKTHVPPTHLKQLSTGGTNESIEIPKDPYAGYPTAQSVRASVPPPPPPPPAPAPILAEMSRVQLKPSSQRSLKERKPVNNPEPEDTRDELLRAIRDFGGSSKLKKISM